MRKKTGAVTGIRFHFVDEAGDLTLKDKHGRIMLGKDGCRKAFMVGLAHVPDPVAAHAALESLRSELLARPDLKDSPSMQVSAKKTAIAFHGSKDLPPVREAVFPLLKSLGVKVYVAIRRKWTMLRDSRLAEKSGVRYNPNSVYDDLVARVFRDHLHKGDGHSIVFARRDNSARTHALGVAIERARVNFAEKWGAPENPPPVQITSGTPPQHTGLQIVDYYLWALQRLYESADDKYFEMMREDYRFIMDIDAKHNKAYGEYYCDANPLSLLNMKAL